MDILFFIADSSASFSSFEMGGLEFYGQLGKFTQKEYRSQDLCMVFISLVDLSCCLRRGQYQYNSSSAIRFSYTTTGCFMVNGRRIENIPLGNLLQRIHQLVDESILYLIKKGVCKETSVLADLINESGMLSALLNVGKV